MGEVVEHSSAVVTEGGARRAPFHDFHEPAEVRPVLLLAVDLFPWCMHDDVVGHKAHRLVEVAAGPCLVIGGGDT